MAMCDYIGRTNHCGKVATTKGTVFIQGENGKLKPLEVNACDIHKKLDGFFEDEKAVPNEEAKEIP